MCWWVPEECLNKLESSLKFLKTVLHVLNLETIWVWIDIWFKFLSRMTKCKLGFEYFYIKNFISSIANSFKFIYTKFLDNRFYKRANKTAVTCRLTIKTNLQWHTDTQTCQTYKCCYFRQRNPKKCFKYCNSQVKCFQHNLDIIFLCWNLTSCLLNRK